MTDLLEKAVTTARALPPNTQDEIARMMLAFVGEDLSVHQLTDEEIADLNASDEEVARGEFASDEQMRAIWAKHGR